MATAIKEDAAPSAEEWAARLDGFVQRAQEASIALRKLDQEAVDRIVWAMTVAGLENAVELAELAMEETHFGVLEDKVLKNYIATEFLYDYLRDKKSVGVIDEDRERALQYVAEPIGVVLALLPITNPTSTTLFKSIVCAKTRNALIMRPSPRAVRCAMRGAEVLQKAGEAVGLPPNSLQVIPDPSLEVSQYLFHHPGVDFIWTTGGPKAVAAANEAGKPCLSVGPGNAPVYVHRSADIRMAVMDILISKTFDASVICPAEQTCVIDEAIYNEMIDEFQRMGAHLLTGEETEALVDLSNRCGASLVIGVIERERSTLYCTALFFNRGEGLVAKHRKLMPTGTERLIWGQGDGSTLPAVETSAGVAGAAICWENHMPLLRTAMYAKGVQIWCAPTVDERDIWQCSMRHIAHEGRCFVISACQVQPSPATLGIDVPGWDNDRPLINGGSLIVGPLGDVLAGPLRGETGLVVAEIDTGELTRARYDFDVVGHYSRPDVFSLSVDERQKRTVAFTSD